jgi:hypothetical protein
MVTEVTEENLRHYYIELNTPLRVMPEIFGIPMGTIRKYLKLHGVEKTQKQAAVNGLKTHLERDPDFYKKLGANLDKEVMLVAHAKGVESRRANRLVKLAAEGKSYEEVYKVFITENTSIIKTAEHFGFSKGGMRKLLGFYGITKTPELIQECKDAGNAKLYADEERVTEMVRKTQATIAERYGNNWYHNTTSKEEEAVRLQIVERFPNLELIHGRYGIIRRPGSGGLMQLDFYFPEINLAVEYNGIRFHDKDAYLQDLKDGTEFSREALKDRLCREESIDLIHIWSDDWKKNISESFESLAKEITAAIEASDAPLALAA